MITVAASVQLATVVEATRIPAATRGASQTMPLAVCPAAKRLCLPVVATTSAARGRSQETAERVPAFVKRAAPAVWVCTRRIPRPELARAAAIRSDEGRGMCKPALISEASSSRCPDEGSTATIEAAGIFRRRRVLRERTMSDSARPIGAVTTTSTTRAPSGWTIRPSAWTSQ
jgi:hypothetical protein